MWAGVMTEPAARCSNWLLTNGGTIELGQTAVIPGNFDGITTADALSADNIKCTIFPGRFNQGTVNCDPNGVGDVGLGLETALTTSTDRKTASSGKRRRLSVRGHCVRLAAKLTAMNATADNNYFLD
jgi:hypothetical protein